MEYGTDFLSQLTYYAFGIQFRQMHIVLLLAASVEEIAVRKAKEYEPDLVMFKRALEVLKGRNFVSVVENGVRAFISK